MSNSRLCNWGIGEAWRGWVTGPSQQLRLAQTFSRRLPGRLTLDTGQWHINHTTRRTRTHRGPWILAATGLRACHAFDSAAGSFITARLFTTVSAGVFGPFYFIISADSRRFIGFFFAFIPGAAEAGSDIFRLSFTSIWLCFCGCSIIVSFDLFSVSSDFRQHSTLYVCFRPFFTFFQTNQRFFSSLWGFSCCILSKTLSANICHLRTCVGFPLVSGVFEVFRGFLLHFCLAFDLRCLIVGSVCGFRVFKCIS